ncbi:MAG TPA: ATP-binding protein [Pyrinomonadaceae bacterium]|jgi:two-component system chemotaxis sensor kinase CheA
MEDFREAFLSESISKLNQLQTDLQSAEPAPELRRELFRTLHTIKGTSQTFGFAVSAILAHTLENLLSVAKNNSIPAEKLKALLHEGIEILIESLSEKDFRISESFREKFGEFQSEMPPEANQSHDYAAEISASLGVQLSNQEKANLNAAMENGNNLNVLEIGFDAADFADEFKAFREKLSAKGEVIAALPGAKFAAQGKIGFQIIYATFEEIDQIIENYPVEIVEQIYQTFSNNLPGVLHQVAGHGKSLAARLGKNVRFEASFEDKEVSPATLKTIFDILLHLARNAVDHGIEREGKIKIELAPKADGIFLKVSDDGRGIDLEKVRRKAVEKNLISGDADLSEPEILNLIFAHGFSTGETVSEISGRGVGLDVVKDLTEKSGGAISVRSEAGKGTTFEILLKEN